jgi:hypothetical protein
MKRILLAIDGLKINLKTLDFACHIGSLTRSNLTAVFLENLVVENKLLVKEGYDATYINWGVNENTPEHQAKMDLIRKNIRIFKDYCANRKIRYDIICEEGTPAKEIIRQSRFGDLLIADAEIGFNEKYEVGPTRFEKEILKKAECPVIIAPESFNRIDEIIFCYDGSRSAIYAMKQFDYFFPELRWTKIVLIEVTRLNNSYLAEMEQVKEWLCRRYDDINIEILQGKTKDELFLYLLQKDNAIFVMGPMAEVCSPGYLKALRQKKY